MRLRLNFQRLDLNMTTDLTNLCLAQLHEHHIDTLAQLKAARIARTHFEREEAKYDALEKAIRAEFDRRYEAEVQDDCREGAQTGEAA